MLVFVVILLQQPQAFGIFAAEHQRIPGQLHRVGRQRNVEYPPGTASGGHRQEQGHRRRNAPGLRPHPPAGDVQRPDKGQQRGREQQGLAGGRGHRKDCNDFPVGLPPVKKLAEGRGGQDEIGCGQDGACRPQPVRILPAGNMDAAQLPPQNGQGNTCRKGHEHIEIQPHIFVCVRFYQDVVKVAILAVRAK